MLIGYARRSTDDQKRASGSGAATATRGWNGRKHRALRALWLPDLAPAFTVSISTAPIVHS